jgi:Restriction endonuclease
MNRPTGCTRGYSPAPRWGGSPSAGYRRVLRHDRQHPARPALHPRPLRRDTMALGEAAGAAEGDEAGRGSPSQFRGCRPLNEHTCDTIDPASHIPHCFMPSTTPLQTLRTQLEAASRQWPSLQHGISFFVDDPDGGNRDRQNWNPPGENQDHFLASGHTVFAPAQFISNTLKPTVLCSYSLSSPNRESMNGAVARFRDIATALWRIITTNWPSLIHAVKCPHPANAYAGVELRAWLGDYWKFYERDKVIKQHEQLRQQGFNFDWDQLYVPEKDEWRLIGAMRPDPELLWGLLLHNLAWRGCNHGPLHAERYTWRGQHSYVIRTIDDLHRFAENSFPIPSNIQLPLRWFASRLQGDVFLASVWAIDELITMIDSSATPEGCVRPLPWEKLTDDGFERFVYSILSSAPDYENPEWLTKTQAPDQGRDLSVWRVACDSFQRTRRVRIFVQCKHWKSRSVAPIDVHEALSRRLLWGPNVDELIIATSGRFTSDAVSVIEKHNNTGQQPSITMWPGSELERIVSLYPNLRKLFEECCVAPDSAAE